MPKTPRCPPRFRHFHAGAANAERAAVSAAAALPLLEGVVLGKPGTVALEFEGEDTRAVWCVAWGWRSR